MLLLPITRETLLQFLPPGGTVAEVGTAKGDFAEDLLKVARPRRLHLIDPWLHHAEGEYQKDNSNVSAEEFEDRYAAVMARFSEPMSTGQVRIHRVGSPEAADLFPDEYFDYVYIDGNHTYEAVLADLRAFEKKVKKDGLILGHDYGNNVLFQNMGFGVIEAVNQFVIETGYEFTCLTNEFAPTFLIAKTVDAPMRNHVMTMIMVMCTVNAPVEIEDAARRQMKQKHVEIQTNQGPLIRTIISY